jgi:hypothetical protein
MDALSEQPYRHLPLYAGLIFFLGGLIAFGGPALLFRARVHEWHTSDRLQYQGAQVQGSLVELIDRRRERQKAYYEYRVRGKDRVAYSYRRVEQLSRPAFQQLFSTFSPSNKRNPITVYYLPDNPAIARITIPASRTERAIMLVVMSFSLPLLSLFLMGGVISLAQSIRRAPLDKQQRLMVMICIGAFLVLMLVGMFIPPSENDMMRGLIWVRS